MHGIHFRTGLPSYSTHEGSPVTGTDNKYETHIFCPERPRGKLHRAFSVMLFNSEGKLLLQQRAKEKITFPSVWTNTCCSHPLSGLDPTEVDGPDDVKAGTVMGVKRAAVRKLKHELGIEADQVPLDKFKFLTRLHYWAADVVTHGPNTPWGEHEIDYILFIQVNQVDLKPNPEEVSDTKWVSQIELLQQMMPESGMLWSPWFRIIATKFMGPWWAGVASQARTLASFRVSALRSLRIARKTD
jgi:isopentenyl-diphosphate delta-isomerase type 1